MLLNIILYTRKLSSLVKSNIKIKPKIITNIILMKHDFNSFPKSSFFIIKTSLLFPTNELKKYHMKKLLFPFTCDICIIINLIYGEPIFPLYHFPLIIYICKTLFYASSSIIFFYLYSCNCRLICLSCHKVLRSWN